MVLGDFSVVQLLMQLVCLIITIFWLCGIDVFTWAITWLKEAHTWNNGTCRTTGVSWSMRVGKINEAVVYLSSNGVEVCTLRTFVPKIIKQVRSDVPLSQSL